MNDRMAQPSSEQTMLLEELAQPFFARFGDERVAIKIARRAAHRARSRLADGQSAAFFCDDDGRHAQVSIPMLDALQSLSVLRAIHFLIRHAPFGQQFAGARLIGAMRRTGVKDKMNCQTVSTPTCC